MVKSRSSATSPYLLARRLAGAAPGLVSLTLTLQPVHMNSRARELLKELGWQEKLTFPREMPMVLRSIAERTCAAAQNCENVADWADVYSSEYVTSPSGSLYLQAFVLFDEVKYDQSKIMVLIEAKHTGNAAVSQENRFQLTEREMEVLSHLAKGLTNKEIGVSLTISEQTVKEHLKHIMEKTHCTTRTAVLMHLLHDR